MCDLEFLFPPSHGPWMEVSQLQPHNEDGALGGGTDRRCRKGPGGMGPRSLNDPTAQSRLSNPGLLTSRLFLEKEINF